MNNDSDWMWKEEIVTSLKYFRPQPAYVSDENHEISFCWPVSRPRFKFGISRT